MTDPSVYEPTYVRRLYVRGYRSIRELDLADLPQIVVLHGENGAGKSNILKAMALPLRWLAGEGPIAATPESATRLDYVSADSQLGIRRDDFNYRAQHEMEFRLEIALGSRATRSVGTLPQGVPLEIQVMVQDVGDGIRCWAPRAHIGEDLALTGIDAQEVSLIRVDIEQARAHLAEIQANLLALREQMRDATAGNSQRVQTAAQIAADEAQVRDIRLKIGRNEKELSGNLLSLDRVRSKLLRREMLRVSDASRRVAREPIGGGGEFGIDPASLVSSEQIQRRLYLLATSSDPNDRAVPRLLATRLAEVMNGSGRARTPLDLVAVRNNEFREYETQLTRGGLDGIPITSLGTGEQQLLILLLDVLMSASPIVQIEEPEAHLHKKLMLRLADVLVRVVEEHDLDQLFIATHHHAFAIAPQYYDVTNDGEHGTRAVMTDRAKALGHFYEPGPLWDALKSLVNSGLRENAVLFRDESGNPVHASEVLASIKEEGPLAKKFAEEMTKTILLSMREEAEAGEK